jgi:hypothetical protein
LDAFPFAYHFDANRLVQYLKQLAAEKGTNLIDGEIVEVRRGPAGLGVDSVLTCRVSWDQSFLENDALGVLS